jgi:GR25 family glycosyltransferase involved in LPS biosynthesis/tetratricopeptide (TPR) repeat protein
VGVLHEYATNVDPVGPPVDVLGDYYFISGRRGARSKDPEKYIKDALLLERGLQEEPTNARYVFYLGNSWMNANQPEKAIAAYKKLLMMDAWAEEKYMACNNMYGLFSRSGRAEEAVPYLIDSVKYVPDRIECVLHLVRHYCGKGDYRVAYAFYTLVQDWYENKYVGQDLSQHLFVDTAAFLFYLPYYVIICAEYTGHLDVAARMYQKIFALNYQGASDWYIGNLYNNMQFCLDALPKTQEFLQAALHYRGRRRFSPGQEAAFARVIDAYRDVMTKTPVTIPILKNKERPRIFLSVTTCKRMDLFTKTMNSIMNTWTDLTDVDYFFCVDDNSTSEDREEIQRLYPFFDYYNKTPQERGHRESMNIIWNKLKELQPTYWIHLEDDWLFFKTDNYVKKSVDFLIKYRERGIRQILFNRNYTETWDWEINSSSPLEPGYIVHVKSDKVVGRGSFYWPHYSFRPSMVDVSTIMELGNYDSPNTFFERDYADRWFAKGYKSGFFDDIVSIHIGRLTSDKDGINAYILNDISQFNIDKPQPHRRYIVNLKRRTDRCEAVTALFKKAGVEEYTFFDAVDGKELTPSDRLTALFADNDFGARRGVIGCALSHLALWEQLLADSNHTYYTIFEDDISHNERTIGLCEGIQQAEATVKKNQTETDILFFGYHSYDNSARLIKGDIQATDKSTYLGGTFGYIITKIGARKCVNYINEHGIKHGIDYLMKMIPYLKFHHMQPHLILSDYVRDATSSVDSDIQKDNTALPSTWRFVEGLDSYGNDLKCIGRKSSKKLLEEAAATPGCNAANTLGYIKSIVGTLTHPTCFKDGDGIWIREGINNISMN